MSGELIIEPIDFDCAWATLVMCGDKYIPGALVLARSLKEHQTSYPIFLMVDGTQTKEGMALIIESKLFHCIKQVPVIEHDSVKYTTPRIAERYAEWTDKSYTKWNCFRPGMFYPFIVRKIMFVDADIAFFANCDDLFDLPAPAARFSSPWSKPYHEWGWNPYGTLTHGHPIFNSALHAALTNTTRSGTNVCDGGMVLITPTTKLWNEFIAILQRYEGKTYGNPKCKSGPDEQILSETIYNIGATFSNIHQAYNWKVGAFHFLLDFESEEMSSKSKFPKPLQDDTGHFIPKVWHYHGAKPWQLGSIGTAQTENQKLDKEDMIKLKNKGMYEPWLDIARKLISEVPAVEPLFSGIRDIPDTRDWFDPPNVPEELDKDTTKGDQVVNGMDDIPQVNAT